MNGPTICADVHYQKGVVYGEDRQLRCEDALTEVVDFVNRKNAYPLMLAGDILHKANMPTDVLLQFERFFNSLDLRGDVIVIGGNHERTHQGNSSLQAIKWPDKVKLVVKKPLVYKHNGIRWFVLPYIHGLMPDYLAQGAKRGLTHVVTHLLLDGAFSRIKLSADILKMHFSGYKLAVLGDVHNRQTLKIPDGALHYAGNLLQNGTDDIGNPQGFISFIKGKMTYIDIKSVKPLAPKQEKSKEDQEQQSIDLEKILTAELPVAASMNAQDCMGYIQKFVDQISVDDKFKQLWLADFTRVLSGDYNVSA